MRDARTCTEDVGPGLLGPHRWMICVGVELVSLTSDVASYAVNNQKAATELFMESIPDPMGIHRYERNLVYRCMFVLKEGKWGEAGMQRFRVSSGNSYGCSVVFETSCLRPMYLERSS